MVNYPIEALQEQVTKPGIYFKMPKEEYHGDKSLSNSGMGKLTQNPQKFWHASPLNPDKEPLDSAALKRGRVFHTLLLEPHKFHQEWKVKVGVETSKVEGMIGEGEYNNIKAAIAKFRKDTRLNGLFAHSYPEVSIFYVDQETGVPCRICTDSLGLTLTVDAKTTRDLSDSSLRYSIPDYGYHRQAAMYLHALAKIKQLIKDGKACVVDCPDENWLEKFLETTHNHFVFPFIELDAPYIYRAEELCELTLEQGVADYKAACHKFKGLYEEYGAAQWPSGYEGRVGVIQRDDLRFKGDF